MITSSPGLTVASSALNSTCLPPVRRLPGSAYRSGIFTFELVAYRLLQRWRAIDGRVFRFTAFDRVDRGFLDVIGRIEVGLTGGKADNILPGRFQFESKLGDGERRRCFDLFQALGKK